MKKVVLPSLFVFIFLVNSCASILNKKTQDITIRTDNPENKVYVDDSLVGTGTSVNTTIKRDLHAKEIRIERAGFEARTYALIQTKKSPYYIMSWIPFGITFYPPFMDSKPNAFNYPKELPVYSCGGEYLAQKEGNKYIYINLAEVQLKAGDFTSLAIPYNRYVIGDMTPFSFAHLSGVYSNDDEIEGESPEFQKILNNVLTERGFMDTTGTILKKMNNTLYIDATLLTLLISC